MFNRVIGKVLKSGAVFILSASVIICFYVWTWRAEVERSHAHRRDTSRYLAVPRVFPETIPLVENIQQKSSSTARAQYKVSTTKEASPVSSRYNSDHSGYEGGNRRDREVGLSGYGVVDDITLQSTTAKHAKLSCIPTPYPSNVSILGRVLERCIPAPSLSTPSGFSQDNIYITIKTTQKNHNTRIRPILLTWLQTVQPDQVLF